MNNKKKLEKKSVLKIVLQKSIDNLNNLASSNLIHSLCVHSSEKNNWKIVSIPTPKVRRAERAKFERYIYNTAAESQKFLPRDYQ